VLTAIVLVVAFFLVSVFTGIWTDRLWFSSLGYLSVFNTVIGTRVVLFIVFGLLLGLITRRSSPGRAASDALVRISVTSMIYYNHLPAAPASPMRHGQSRLVRYLRLYRSRSVRMERRHRHTVLGQ
jgi:uncharacterized membrane protein (UPF0182 family)